MTMQHQRAFATAAAIAIGAAVVLPVMFGDAPEQSARSGEDAWRTVLFDFQTLFAGIFAVAAAMWTVFTMEQTERQAARRHSEQIALALRADTLKVDRALYPQFKELMNSRKNLRTDLENVVARRNDPNHLSSPLRFEISSIRSEVNNIAALLKRPHFLEGAALFDADLNHRVWDLRKRVDNVLQSVEIAYNYFHGEGRHSADDVRHFEYDVFCNEGGEERIEGFVSYYVNHSEPIFEAMRRLARTYKIER
ncbi:hypothetical protein [Shinella sp. G-2]|uniref:hypothetical protein n=1 Tax=Shinella sp. G-2 TaxID=3133141 RepID=UPI003CFC1526